METIRKIIHIDMDYFYAQVEERDNKALKNVPFAIGGEENNRGVISTCNYIARSYGVHSAMPTAQARKLCPKIIILPTNMDKYKEASCKIRDVFREYTDLYEPLSLDEAYLDVTSVDKLFNSATLIANEIRKIIYTKTGLTSSAGISGNKLLSKIASDINKPNGFFVIRPLEVLRFISTLSVSKIPGVGKVTHKKMLDMGIKECLDLQRKSKQFLSDNFGKFGVSLYDYCRGIDHRAVIPNRLRKSISVENTLTHNIYSIESCYDIIKSLHKKLEHRITRANIKGIRTIFIKITDGSFKKFTIERSSNVYDISLYLLLFKVLYEKSISRLSIRMHRERRCASTVNGHSHLIVNAHSHPTVNGFMP